MQTQLILLSLVLIVAWPALAIGEAEGLFRDDVISEFQVYLAIQDRTLPKGLALTGVGTYHLISGRGAASTVVNTGKREPSERISSQNIRATGIFSESESALRTL